MTVIRRKQRVVHDLKFLLFFLCRAGHIWHLHRSTQPLSCVWTRYWTCSGAGVLFLSCSCHRIMGSPGKTSAFPSSGLGDLGARGPLCSGLQLRFCRSRSEVTCLSVCQVSGGAGAAGREALLMIEGTPVCTPIGDLRVYEMWGHPFPWCSSR